MRVPVLLINAAVTILLSTNSLADVMAIPGFMVSLDVPAGWHTRMTTMAPPGLPAKQQFLLEAPALNDEESTFCHVMSRVYAHPVSDAEIQGSHTFDETKKKTMLDAMARTAGMVVSSADVGTGALGNVPGMTITFAGTKVVEGKTGYFSTTLLAGSTHVQAVTFECSTVSSQSADRVAALAKASMPVLQHMFSSVRFEATQAQDGGQ